MPDLLSQLRSKPVSGEHLELLGKTAAGHWLEGRHKTLTEAVISTVKEAHLSPEQIKRVVEFTNTEAFLHEFKKESAAHRVVHFDCGPASPVDVLHALNHNETKVAMFLGEGLGYGAQSMDKTASFVNDDYASPPQEMQKASSYTEDEFISALQREDSPYPYENPVGPLYDLRVKLSSAEEHVSSMLSGVETAYEELSDRVYRQVKQAALSGHSLGEVVQAWQDVAPSLEHVKVAFAMLVPRLQDDGLFLSEESLGQSFGKTANARVNQQHPLVTEFSDYCDSLSKLAELDAAKSTILAELGKVEVAIKEAEGGLWGVLTRGADQLSKPVGRGAKKLTAALVGKGEGSKAVGELAGGLVRYSPHIGVGLAAKHVYDTSPGLQAVAGKITNSISGTPYLSAYGQGGY